MRSNFGITQQPMDRLATLSLHELQKVEATELRWMGFALQRSKEHLQKQERKFHETLLTRYRHHCQAPFETREIRDGSVCLFARPQLRIHWNQDRLKAMAARMQSMNVDTDQFFVTSWSVDESRYQQWPQPLKSQFETARSSILESWSFEFDLTPPSLQLSTLRLNAELLGGTHHVK